MNKKAQKADICLILEGTYPYVTGGVSTWVQSLLTAQKNLSFYLLTIITKETDMTLRYEIPNNVLGIKKLFIQDLPPGKSSLSKSNIKSVKSLEEPLLKLQSNGGLKEIKKILNIIKPNRGQFGEEILLNSIPAWEILLNIYYKSQPQSSFLDFFWTWRTLQSSLFSLLFAEIPPASVYHAVSTGFAGLFASYAHLETGRPALVTEHGIYTNERWIEIKMGNWPYEMPSTVLSIDSERRGLKDLMINTFISYSRACYEACSSIITVYDGNQQMQIEDGAAFEKLDVIYNGIEPDLYETLKQEKSSDSPPVIALVGRIVPIKDIKTFIRACSIVSKIIPKVQILIIGPTDEDSDYFDECKALVNHLGINKFINFTGNVNIEKYFPQIDIIVLTSISEAMPIIILEAGTAGIPIVSTNVGACREMIHGTAREKPNLGKAGILTPLSNPAATADAIMELIVNKNFHQECSKTIKKRIKLYYNKSDTDKKYLELYQKYCSIS